MFNYVYLSQVSMSVTSAGDVTEAEESTGRRSPQIMSPERAVHTARPSTTCPAQALASYPAHPSSAHADHLQVYHHGLSFYMSHR